MAGSKARVAVVQMLAGPRKADNLSRALSFIDQAVADQPGLDAICLPEYCYCVASPDDVADVAEPIGGPFTEAIAAAARRRRVNIVAGSFPERAQGDRMYNTCLLFNRAGEIAGEYRKTHLMDAMSYKESDSVVPGEWVKTFETDFGRIGLMVCFDLRFPELARTMALEGADTVFVPAAFPSGQALPPRTDHWDLLTRATALLNLAWVVAANQYGSHASDNYFGRSAVIDPWGVPVAQATPGEGVIYATLDYGFQRDLRRRLPVLAARRPDLYRL